MSQNSAFSQYATHHLILSRYFHPTYAQSPPRLSVSSDQATAPYSNQDDYRSPWWCQLTGIGGLGGGGCRGPQKQSFHLGVWRLPCKFSEWLSALIHVGGPFQSIYLYRFDFLLLLHIPVLSNQSALRLHWCSHIHPIWGVRVHSYALFLFLPICNPCHSPIPHLHLSCLDLSNGDNCPLSGSIIICNSNQKVPWWSSLWCKVDHWVSSTYGL